MSRWPPSAILKFRVRFSAVILSIFIDVDRRFTQLPQLEYAIIPPSAFTVRHTQLRTHSEQQ